MRLHVHMHIYHRKLTRIAPLLRPMDKIQRISQSTHKATVHYEAFLEIIIGTKKHPLETPEHTPTFVINLIFSVLMGATFTFRLHNTLESISNHEDMLIWYNTYRYVRDIIEHKCNIHKPCKRPNCFEQSMLFCQYRALHHSPTRIEKLACFPPLPLSLPPFPLSLSFSSPSLCDFESTIYKSTT